VLAQPCTFELLPIFAVKCTRTSPAVWRKQGNGALVTKTKALMIIMSKRPFAMVFETKRAN